MTGTCRLFVRATVSVGGACFLGMAVVGSAQAADGTARSGATPRTLDEISIEGEIVMPQVLFITAREPYRFVDTAHRDYLVHPDSLAARATLPASIWIGRAFAPVPHWVGRSEGESPTPSDVEPSSTDPGPEAPASAAPDPDRKGGTQ